MNILRQIVSGKKNRMTEAGYNLDLTYVCPRVIAMSFPAEGLEIAFRNNINDVLIAFVEGQVSSFIKERHGNDFAIYNLSGRPYDIRKFDNQVYDFVFAWEDHHSPPIHILFKLCKNVDDFLGGTLTHLYIKAKLSNVISVHCLAGKGRTGTAICCYLLYCGRFDNSEDVLLYYAKKRFQKGGGVTQPSQRRYVAYFERLLTTWRITPVLKYIVSVTLGGIPCFQKNKSCRPYIEIYNVKENKLVLIYTDKTERYKEQRKYSDMNNPELNIIKVQILTPFVVLGDVMIKIYQHNQFKQEAMFRFAFNTAFLQDQNKLRFEKNQLDPDKIRRDPRFPPNFFVEINLSDYCRCTSQTPFESKCKDCSKFMGQVRPDWETIYSIMKDYKKHSVEESKIMLFGDPDFDDFNEILYTRQMPQLQEAEADEDEDEECSTRVKKDTFFQASI